MKRYKGKPLRRALLIMWLAGCGGAATCHDLRWPNEAPGDLCCDAEWRWCLDADGGKVGAP